MKQRGRKSAGELAVASPVKVHTRPEAPVELTPEQADVWVAVVDRMPADWFADETFPLLCQYCRHTIEARRLAQLIDQECARGETDVPAYLELLKAQQRETASLKAMAAAMRISQQSTRTERAAGVEKRARTVARPWQG